MTAAHTAAHALALLPAGKGDPTWFDNPALTDKFVPAILETLMMTGQSTIFAVIIGTLLGLLLVQTGKGGLTPNKGVYQAVSFVVNIVRSLPFIILMIAIMPFTKALVGTKIGVPGAIVPLVVSAAPFIARMVETSLAEVDAGVVEAAQSMGASNLQIVWKVYLPEAVPSLILGASISIITLLGYTAIAGAVGAGGLGDLAVRYGYQRRVTSMMVVTVIFIIILVQVIQSVFSWLSTKLDKRLR